MTKIDIISGFLGAGKTTLIKKLLKMRSLENRLFSSRMNLAKSELTVVFLKKQELKSVK